VLLWHSVCKQTTLPTFLSFHQLQTVWELTTLVQDGSASGFLEGLIANELLSQLKQLKPSRAPSLSNAYSMNYSLDPDNFNATEKESLTDPKSFSQRTGRLTHHMKFPPPDEIQDITLKRFRVAMSSWKLLRNIVSAHKDTIRKR
jgi:hypothetical protein